MPLSDLVNVFRQATQINVPAAALERWHHRPGALQRLTPPWESMRVLEEPPEIKDGETTVLEIKAGPKKITWVAEHVDCHAGGFTDIQSKGPFKDWIHEHRFENVDEETSQLVDEVRYRVPLGVAGRLAAGGVVSKKLERTFRYRHALTKMDLERWNDEPTGDGEPKTILITGATGMVGRAATAYLRMRGHRILRVTRHPKMPDDIRWDLDAGELDLPKDLTVHAAVHLAGENIAGGRWSDAQKRRIMESRRKGTRLLAKTLAERDQPPQVLVSASGVNYHAQGTEKAQAESDPRGTGFLADVCEVWESETVPAEEAGIRVARLRFGIILSPAGGALAKMLPLFKVGLGGALGCGRQRMAWVALDDVVDVVHRAIRDDRYSGAINVVAPETVTNAAFTRTLAHTLHRPAVARVPAKALEMALGERMAEETLLADLHVKAGKLESLAYPFRFSKVDAALKFLLGRPA